MNNYGAAACLRQVRRLIIDKNVRGADFRNYSFFIFHFSFSLRRHSRLSYFPLIPGSCFLAPAKREAHRSAAPPFLIFHSSFLIFTKSLHHSN